MLRWVGVHWGCKLALSIALLWHGVAGVAAVWLGAQTPTRTAWVQAGIADDSFGTYLYAEWKRPGHRPIDVYAPAFLGDVKTVRLEHQGGYWRAQIGELSTPWVRLRGEIHCNALELQNGAHAGAALGLRYEHG